MRPPASAAVSTYYREGVAALSKNRYAEAESLLTIVVDQEPDYVPGLLSLAQVLQRSGHPNQARPLFEKALELEASVETLTELGGNLLVTNKEAPNRIQQLERALALGQAARDLDEKSFRTQMLITRSAGILTTLVEPADTYWAEASQAAEICIELEPNSPNAHYCVAQTAANSGDWTRAKSHALRARKLGKNPETVDNFLKKVDASRRDEKKAFFHGLLTFVLVGVSVWATGLLIIFMVGRFFSRRTLAIIGSDMLNSESLKATRNLRNYYRHLLNFSGHYYYLSNAFISVVLVVLTATFIYHRASGYTVELYLILATGFAALVSILTTILAWTVEMELVVDGKEIEYDEAPELWDLIRELAELTGTRSIDKIWVTPGTDLSVLEEGAINLRLQDRASRTLIIGLDLLDGLDLNAFKCMLTHEYGHFLHGDTAGGEVVVRVSGSLMATGTTLEDAHLSQLWNISYCFLVLYDYLFSRIALGASRMQEVLADQLAVENFGNTAFQTGLNHSIRKSVVLESCLAREFDAALEESRPISDIQDLITNIDGSFADELEEIIEEIKATDTCDKDSHPGLKERFRLAALINRQDPGLDGRHTAIDLFLNKEDLIAEMQTKTQKALNQRINP